MAHLSQSTPTNTTTNTGHDEPSETAPRIYPTQSGNISKLLQQHQHQHSVSSTNYHRPSSTDRPDPTRHISSPSISTIKRHHQQQRSTSGGILSLAAAALDKTQNALANLPSSSIRPRHSNSALARLSRVGGSSSASEPGSPERFPPYFTSSPSTNSLASLSQQAETKPTLAHPPSQRYSETDPSLPAPIKLRGPNNTMHQTSSRLLRMTDDDRPFTKDFKDLFATLIVSLLPLSAHRVRLSRVEYTFLSEDAINNLGSLKFSQSNRMPDPKDPSRIVTTTTTTTFSMAKDMARSICQRFVEARFIESADGKYQQTYHMKGSVWQLTSKGIAVLDTFCARNGIQQKQVAELAALNAAQLVFLERDQQSDKLLHDRGTIEVIFRRFVGTDGRNIKSNTNAADSDSLHDYKDGLTGVKMAAERKIGGRTFQNTFTGKATADWLMDCSTIVDRRETVEIASLFIEYEFMETVQADRTYPQPNPAATLFQPTKHAIYQLTQRGKDIINGNGSRGRTSESENGTGSQRNGITRDSNTQRLEKILADPALRLLFRENLRDMHCEENLSFYMDVDEFIRNCKTAVRQAQKNPTANSMDGVKEIMAQAYGIYNAFLAPGSPCELNIDHQLRNNLATRMTKAVGQDGAMIETLQEVNALFEDAQLAVFKLMASDSVPKFLRNAKFEQQLRSYESDLAIRGSEQSQTRSNRQS